MRTIKQKRKGRNIALYAVFALLAVVLLFPYFFMINRGLMSNEFILQPKTRFFPDGLHFENYGLAFREGGYGKPFLNSVIVTLVVTVSVPLSSFLAAYAFARLRSEERR